MNIDISVIICTYNPRAEYLEEALKALKDQTLPISQWELLLIDNASDQPLSSEIDISWHPHSRHLREEKLGKTHALLLGIKEAVGELIVIVDDDNVLDTTYLEVALHISKDWPMLGAWGGQIVPDFEETPPEWTKPYWWMIAIREFEQDKWSNLLHCYDTAPVGAGMCVRKSVANKYAELAMNDSSRSNLDPKGKQLLRSGDQDLAFTSCDLGLGTGLFVSLKLTHLIPARRLEKEYLLKLAEGISYSVTIMESLRGKVPDIPKVSLIRKLIGYYRLMRMEPIYRSFHQAIERGKALAIKEIKNF
jgi:glycosyltransferase involved in cell wall biosynthesis